MSLLGIDVGTTGCKAASFTLEGAPLAQAYREYAIQRPQPGWAELDSRAVWSQVQDCIAEVVAATHSDPIQALAVSSLGEAFVPVTKERQILGPSPLNSDSRGQAYVPSLSAPVSDDRLFEINGNVWGNHYSLPKLLWLRDHRPDIYAEADCFLLWSPFIAFMLGAEPVVDYSLANRTLLLDIDRCQWSDELLALTGIPSDKLPRLAPSATQIGQTGGRAAREIGLRPGIPIVTGAHDQCANAVGCGVIEPGHAVFGMGTVICITPVFTQRPAAGPMIAQGLNVEHHAAPGRYVSFIYNQGGALVRWYRDTFAAAEHASAQEEHRDIYDRLFAEVDVEPSCLMVLPHFEPTGPPDFVSDSAGVIAGLHLDTSRGDILRAILEGTAFYLRECVEALPEAGLEINSFHAVGGGSKSDVWVQICANIMGRPFVRPRVTEAGALGAAILAGVGSGTFASCEAGVQAAVHPERSFTPDPSLKPMLDQRFELYRQLAPLMQSYLKAVADLRSS